MTYLILIALAGEMWKSDLSHTGSFPIGIKKPVIVDKCPIRDVPPTLSGPHFVRRIIFASQFSIAEVGTNAVYDVRQHRPSNEVSNFYSHIGRQNQPYYTQ